MGHKSIRRRILRGLLLLVALLGAARAQATTVRIANLQDLTEHANRIFVGRCLSAQSGRMGNVPYTAYTFQVLEPVRGVEAATITLRQLGAAEALPLGDGQTIPPGFPGMPRYAPGQMVLLFLSGESPLGLSSPVGLAQGAFRVQEHGGVRSLVNGVTNRNLGHGLSTAWLRSKGLSSEEVIRLQAGSEDGALDYDFFLRVLRKIGRVEP